MSNNVVFAFDGEETRRLDIEHLLKRLQNLHDDLLSASSCRSVRGGKVYFSLNFLMADILDCLDLLTYNNLSHLIGIEKATKVWPDVKR
ncbi:MAG: hypothetical protein VB108_01410 [Anaerolineaceae bacterium]|nr:hypothetical protein [Anaerolineaceae bacterium]